MVRRPEEHDRPDQWLAGIDADPSAPTHLVRQSGSLVYAAWRLAAARRRAARAPQAPTAVQLRSAVVELAERVGWFEPMPTQEAMVNECVGSGLRLAY